MLYICYTLLPFACQRFLRVCARTREQVGCVCVRVSALSSLNIRFHAVLFFLLQFSSSLSHVTSDFLQTGGGREEEMKEEDKEEEEEVPKRQISVQRWRLCHI